MGPLSRNDFACLELCHGRAIHRTGRDKFNLDVSYFKVNCSRCLSRNLREMKISRVFLDHLGRQ